MPFGLLTDAAFSFLLLFYVVNFSSGIDSEHGSKLHIRSAPLFQADFFFSFEGMRNAREFLECLRKPHQLQKQVFTFHCTGMSIKFNIQRHLSICTIIYILIQILIPVGYQYQQVQHNNCNPSFGELYS